MKDNISKKVASNLLWRLMERFGAQFVTFVVSIVLARLLDPTIYGVVALLTVFITILQVFVDSGLGTALIQKKDADQLDFSTVFYTNIVYCVILYTGLFFLSPLIANFYDNPDLTPLIRVLGITILISGVKNIEQAYVSRHMMFKKFFWATLVGTLISAVVGIVMAINGLGPWALIVQSLTNVFIDTVVLWIIVKWRPTREFSLQRLKQLYKFGWKLLASALLDTGYNELRQLVIGKRYSSEQLAYYNKGRQFPNLLATNINNSIDSVLLPTMSSEQEHKERVRSMTRRALKTSVFIMAPMMVGIAAIGDNFIMLLLGEKWMDCVFFMRIFCITYIFYPVHTANLNAMKAMGRSDYFLILEVTKKVIGIASILITMWISVEAIAWSLLVTTALSMFINAFPNKKLLNYSYFDQMKDILPAVLIAGVMGVGVYFIQYIPSPHYLLTMFVQIIVGIVFYFLVCRLLKLESYFYVRNMVFEFVNTKMIYKKRNNIAVTKHKQKNDEGSTTVKNTSIVEDVGNSKVANCTKEDQIKK